jgi:putative glutamine amidotransferase
MSRPPLILISPGMEKAGFEFSDRSISLSEAYPRAVMAAGGVPVIAPSGTSRAVVAECVRRCDGVLLTGGDDVEPELYESQLPAAVRRTVGPTPDDGARTLRELILIDEIFRQRKPTLAICRGSQLMNVALGGTLVVDIRLQVPGALNHQRMDRRNDRVHEVRLTSDSLLAKITRRRKLGVNSTHHQAVGRVAEPLRAVAVSADGVVEAVELQAEVSHWLPFFVGVQFHPERLQDRWPEHRALFQAFTRACGPQQRKKL